MAKSTIASLEARIAALETAFAARKAETDALLAGFQALNAQLSAPRPRRWEPSQSAQQLKAEYLRRKAAGENVVIRSGKCVLAHEPKPDFADQPF